MMAKANQKGKKGELEFAKVLKNYFPHYKEKIGRTAGQETYKFSFNGDVHCFNDSVLSEIAWEVKRREREQIREWLEKIVDDCGPTSSQTPVVVSRKNNTDWIVSLQVSDFLKILYELDGWRRDFE